MKMERSSQNSICKIISICLINVMNYAHRWMVVAQVLQAIIILAVGYTYRSLKKRMLQGARPRLGINHNDAQ